MAIGPGKYDDLATYVREKTGAHSVIVVVIGGNKGEGFAMQTDDVVIMMKTPEILRALADEIENSK